MQTAMRRLIVIIAIAAIGSGAGLALGSFVAGDSRPSGAEELEAYSRSIAMGNESGPSADLARTGFTAQSGPSSYVCDGCDARLYDDVVSDPADMAADLAPLPPYRAEEALPVLQSGVASGLLAAEKPPADQQPAAAPALPPQ